MQRHRRHCSSNTGDAWKKIATFYVPSFFYVFPSFSSTSYLFSLVVFDVLRAFSSTMRRCYFQYFPSFANTHSHSHIYCNKRERLHSDAYRTYTQHYIFCCCRLQIFVCVIFLVDFLFCSVFILCVLLFVFSFFFSDQHVCNDCSIVCNESTSFVIRFGRKIILVRFVVVFLY